MKLSNYVCGEWIEGKGQGTTIQSAVNGASIAVSSAEGLDFSAVLDYARSIAGPEIRKMTFHQRADALKKLVRILAEKKEELYALSVHTGATRNDSWIDIEGGIGTANVMASKGLKELPDETFLVEGSAEPLSRGQQFVGQHILTPLQGAAVHINAFNFPCWGLLEKFAPAFMAGLPVVAKPATATAYLAHAVAKQIIESGLLPKGALQLIVGSAGDLFDHLDGQDVVAFTGSAETSEKLQRHPTVARNAVRFTAERDSLNACVLGGDATPGTPEFELFVNEVAREMTVKTGQKCTAIRRVIVPNILMDAVQDALVERLKSVKIGDPGLKTTQMGPLVSLAQRDEVLQQLERLKFEADVIMGHQQNLSIDGADPKKGGFIEPVLLRTKNSKRADAVHHVEAFGPVSTMIGYEDTSDAVALVCRGKGSLVASVVSFDDDVIRELIMGIAPYHGRLLVLDRECANESTGHGIPLAPLVHGGPGRAGGGEELGGVRAVKHYMQRTAVQGTPVKLAHITKQKDATPQN